MDGGIDAVANDEMGKQRALEEASEKKMHLIRKVMDKVERNMKVICMHSTRIEQTGHYAKRLIGFRGHQLKMQDKAMQCQAKVANEDLSEFISNSSMREDIFNDIDQLINDHLSTLGNVVETMEMAVDKCLVECNSTFQLIADEFVQGDAHEFYRNGVAENFKKCVEVTDTLIQLSNMHESNDDAALAHALGAGNGKRQSRSSASSSIEPIDMQSDNEDGDRRNLSSCGKRRNRSGDFIDIDEVKEVSKIEMSPYFLKQQQQQQQQEQQQQPERSVSSTEVLSTLVEINSEDPYKNMSEILSGGSSTSKVTGSRSRGGFRASSSAKEGDNVSTQVASLDKDMGNFEADSDDATDEDVHDNKRQRTDGFEKEAEATFSPENLDNGHGSTDKGRRNGTRSTKNADVTDLT